MKKRLTYYIWPLGCAMNYADSERVAMVLDNLELKETKKESSANVIAVMACSVRQSAIDRILGKAAVWKNLRKRQLKLIILSGCVLPADKPKMTKIFDIIFNILELNQLPKLINDKLKNLGMPRLKISAAITNNNDYWQIIPKRKNKFQTLIPISFGCNKFCAYCAVPYTRGIEKNRTSSQILAEVKQAAKNKVKEIILLGQTVNSYKNPEADKGQAFGYRIKNFNDLLTATAKLARDSWIRFSSPYPTEFNNQLIETVAKHQNICKHFHLPVQSGSNKILKAMNRRYTCEQYLEIIKKIRKIIPIAAITTDTIVGFCGETNKNFQETIDLYKKAKFDMAYIAQYSARAGTVSQKIMKDDIPKKTKIERERKLNDVLAQTAFLNNKKYLGKTVGVLVEEKRKNFYLGKTDTFKTVKIAQPKNLSAAMIGRIITVKITKTESFGLEGKII